MIILILIHSCSSGNLCWNPTSRQGRSGSTQLPMRSFHVKVGKEISCRHTHTKLQRWLAPIMSLIIMSVSSHPHGGTADQLNRTISWTVRYILTYCIYIRLVFVQIHKDRLWDCMGIIKKYIIWSQLEVPENKYHIQRKWCHRYNKKELRSNPSRGTASNPRPFLPEHSAEHSAVQ